MSIMCWLGYHNWVYTTGYSYAAGIEHCRSCGKIRVFNEDTRVA